MGERSEGNDWLRLHAHRLSDLIVLYWQRDCFSWLCGRYEIAVSASDGPNSDESTAVYLTSFVSSSTLSGFPDREVSQSRRHSGALCPRDLVVQRRSLDGHSDGPHGGFDGKSGTYAIGVGATPGKPAMTA